MPDRSPGRTNECARQVTRQTESVGARQATKEASCRLQATDNAYARFPRGPESRAQAESEWNERKRVIAQQCEAERARLHTQMKTSAPKNSVAEACQANTRTDKTTGPCAASRFRGTTVLRMSTWTQWCAHASKHAQRAKPGNRKREKTTAGNIIVRTMPFSKSLFKAPVQW